MTQPGYVSTMAMRHVQAGDHRSLRQNAARPDRQARLLLVTTVAIALTVFVWLLVTLYQSAFG
jgi:hypothetical protein